MRAADGVAGITILGITSVEQARSQAGAGSPITTAPLAPEALAEAVEAEARAYMRRMDVCTELRRVALEKNDELLLRQVEELEGQASNLYNQRTAALGVKKSLPAMPAVLDAQTTPMDSRASLTRGVTR